MSKFKVGDEVFLAGVVYSIEYPLGEEFIEVGVCGQYIEIATEGGMQACIPQNKEEVLKYLEDVKEEEIKVLEEQIAQQQQRLTELRGE